MGFGDGLDGFGDVGGDRNKDKRRRPPPTDRFTLELKDHGFIVSEHPRHPPLARLLMGWIMVVPSRRSPRGEGTGGAHPQWHNGYNAKSALQGQSNVMLVSAENRKAIPTPIGLQTLNLLSAPGIRAPIEEGMA